MSSPQSRASKPTTPVPGRTIPPWARYVAIGDSFTEGMMDLDPHDKNTDKMLGWADRLAAELSRLRIEAGLEPLEYANLAIRGRKIRAIHSEQLAPALAMKPDLMSIVAGGNDLIRLGAKPDLLAARLHHMVRQVRQTGCEVILVTSSDPAGSPFLQRTRQAVGIFNSHLFSIARQEGCYLANQWALQSLKNPRMWADDRLHLSSTGHQILASEVLVTLGFDPLLPDYDAPPPPGTPKRFTTTQNLSWMWKHALPWVVRHARGKSSGDGRLPKYPQPVTAPPIPRD